MKLNTATEVTAARAATPTTTTASRTRNSSRTKKDGGRKKRDTRDGPVRPPPPPPTTTTTTVNNKQKQEPRNVSTMIILIVITYLIIRDFIPLTTWSCSLSSTTMMTNRINGKNTINDSNTHNNNVPGQEIGIRMGIQNDNTNVTNHTTGTAWCIIDSSHKYDLRHPPHSSQILLPCWNWFYENDKIHSCGLAFLDNLTLSSSSSSSISSSTTTTTSSSAQEQKEEWNMYLV